MPFFGDNYTLRRFGKSTIVNGYPTEGYVDESVFLDVQTVSDEATIEESGSRDQMLLKTFGDFPIQCSKQDKGVVSDQILYDGRWYECISSKLSRNTFIKHWTSTFSLIPEDKNPDPESDTETEVSE